jgi:hypothetical protein
MTVSLQTVIDRLKADLGVSEQSSAVPRPISALGASLRSSGEPETREAADKLAGALAFISSDVPRGNGSVLSPNGQPAEDYWLGVVWAIAGLNWSCGEALAREWSMASDRYDDAAFTKDWKACNPLHNNPVGIGSVYKLAKARGWVDVAYPTPSAEPSRYQILRRADILAIPPIQWRVKGLLPTKGLAAIYGPSGSGKSFLALDLSFAIASGVGWFDRRTAQCPVTYVMLEGEAGLHNRLKAWEQHYGKDSPSAFGAIVQPFGLMETQQVDDLGSVLPLGGVVMIDTLNRAAPAADENSSSDMGRILEGAKMLQRITDGLVVLIHHTGKDATKGLRGHSSLHAALDAGVEVERTAAGRSWRVGKAKDGEDGLSVPFALRRVLLGTDSDGDEVSSCVVERDAGAVHVPREPSGKNQICALRAVRACLAAAATTGKAGCGSQTRCITVDAAKAAIVQSLATTEPNKRNNVAKTLLDGLCAGGFLKAGVHGDDGWVWQVS